MEVIEPVSALLSDYEVYAHLLRNKNGRLPNKHAPENVQTIEFEALDYFAKLTPVPQQSPDVIAEMLRALLPHQLTKAEKLQIVNLVPRSLVEFYLIVEECEERFSDEQIEEILRSISALLPETGCK